MEALLIFAVFGIPAFAGYVLARRCSRHRLAIVVLMLAFGVILFASSTPYAAFTASLITTTSAGLGYFFGRLGVRKLKSRWNT